MLKKSLLISLLIIFILCGAGITIITKYIYNEQSKGINFNHDIFINLLMFFAEMFGLPLLCIISHKKSKKSTRTDSDSINDEIEKKLEENEEKGINISNSKKVLYSIIPFIIDNIATFLCSMSLNYLSGSIYTMIKGITIILFTLLWSKFLLKNKHIIDHYIAIIIAAISSVFIGIELDLSQNNNTKEIILGILVVFTAMLLQSFQFIYEEYYMKKYMISQFFMIGFEGVFGFIFNIILCFSFYYIKCDESSKFTNFFCVKDDKGIWRAENIFFCFEQIIDNKTIMILVIILIFIFGGFNIFGVSIIKYNGAVTRCLIDNFRSFVVWIYFLFPWVDVKLKEKFDWFGLIGLIFIFFAILIYFGIFKIDEKITIRRKMKELANNNENLVVSRESSINE
jgi:hypothetical protein